jgi:uncharacterized protein (DUF302 family)
MLYITETTKDFETAVRDLEEAVKRRKYGVLLVHDLQKTLKEKGRGSIFLTELGS